jgi:HlyD family secretion protein
MQRYSWIIGTAVLACSFGMVGCFNGDGKSVEGSGTIEGTEVNVGTEAVGRVLAVRCDEGAWVKKGDTLLVIDDTEYRIQLRQAEANNESYASQYRLALDGSRKEDITQAEAAYKTAQADYQRMKDLLASQTVTQKQYDDAYSRFVAAEQTYRKLKTGLRPEEIVNAKTRAEYSSAQVDLLRKKVRDCVLVSPTDGVITVRAIEPGELVGMGSNVFRITDLHQVKLMIYVPEQEVPKVKLGQSASVKVDAFPGKSYEGKVVYISSVAEFTPKNVQTKEERTKLVFGVKIEIANPNGELKPGVPADASMAYNAASGK